MSFPCQIRSEAILIENILLRKMWRSEPPKGKLEGVGGQNPDSPINKQLTTKLERTKTLNNPLVYPTSGKKLLYHSFPTQKSPLLALGSRVRPNAPAGRPENLETLQSELDYWRGFGSSASSGRRVGERKRLVYQVVPKMLLAILVCLRCFCIFGLTKTPFGHFL